MRTGPTTRRVLSEKLNLAQFSRAMGSLQAPTDENKTETETKLTDTTIENVEKPTESDTNVRFEGKVTPEQELSASVSRKRRNISKKRSESAHRPRDVTPARDLLAESPSVDDEQPKKPERKLSKTNSNNSNKNGNDVNDKQINDKNVNTTQEASKESIPTQEENKVKEETVPKKEIVNHDLPQVKQNVTIIPREKPARMKRDKLLKKRSQSTPRPTTENEEKGTKDDLEQQKTKLIKEKELADLKNDNKTPIIKNGNIPDEEKKMKLRRENEVIEPKKENAPSVGTRDLIEDFKQAQVLSAKLEVIFKPSSSESSVESTESNKDEKVKRRKPYTPAAQQFLERRKLEKQLSETKSDVDKKKPDKQKKKRMTFKELRENWRYFKIEYSEECYKIRNLRNKCLNEICLMMIFCGFGGLIFKFTEGAFENFYKCGVKRVKRDFIDILWRGSHNLREDDWKALARTKLRDFEEQLHTAHEAGVHSYSGQRSWSFLNGVVYSLTIVTTIGKLYKLFKQYYKNLMC